MLPTVSHFIEAADIGYSLIIHFLLHCNNLKSIQITVRINEVIIVVFVALQLHP